MFETPGFGSTAVSERQSDVVCEELLYLVKEPVIDLTDGDERRNTHLDGIQLRRRLGACAVACRLPPQPVISDHRPHVDR